MDFIECSEVLWRKSVQDFVPQDNLDVNKTA